MKCISFQASSTKATKNQPTIVKHTIIITDASTKIGSTGIVTSPGYGITNYPNNIDIAYIFLSPPGSGIRIKFTVSPDINQ